MSMLDRVARAIEAADNGSSPELLARAAIEAMREPSEAIVDAAIRATSDGRGNRQRRLWEAMIDAALAETNHEESRSR